MTEPNQQPIEGEVVQLWRSRPWLLQLGLGLFVALGSVFLLATTELVELGTLRAVALWIELALGVALALFAGGNLLINVRNNPRLILGAERVQYARGAGVLVDVPYEEIEDVGVDKHGWFFRAIGLHLAHPPTPDGAPNPAIRLLQKSFGYDALIPADLPQKRLEDLVLQIRMRMEEGE